MRSAERISSTIGRSSRCASIHATSAEHQRDERAGATDDPHLAREVALLDALQLRAQRRRRRAQARARDGQLERAEHLQIAELAPHGALLLGSERAGPRVRASRLEQQRAVGTQHAHGDSRVVLQQRGGDATDGVVVARAQCILERGCGGSGEIAGERIETLDLGGEERALALIADCGARLAIVEILEHEQRRGDAQSREQRNQK